MSLLQRFSGISLSSHTTNGVGEELNYEDMTEKELKENLEYAIHSNKIIALENEVFERYLHRNDLQSLIPMTQVLDTATAISSQMTQMSLSHFRSSASVSGFSMRERNTTFSPSTGSIQTFVGSRGAQASVVQLSTRGLRIALSQRIEMANREIEEMRKELEECGKQTKKKRANLCAQLEEIQMRIHDVNKARKELEENVVRKEVDSSEKFNYYIEMWLKNADRMIDKLQLKNSTIKSQIRKAMTQLKQQEELGESLHLIDFQALVIKNEIDEKQIVGKTQQLIRLKKITGRYSFALSRQKDKLNELQITLSNMKNQIKIQESQIEKLNSDLEKTKIQLYEMEKNLNKAFKPSHDENEISDVIEIIRSQTEIGAMKKTFTRLERHGSIQLMAIKAIKKNQQLIEQRKVEPTANKK